MYYPFLSVRTSVLKNRAMSPYAEHNETGQGAIYHVDKHTQIHKLTSIAPSQMLVAV